MAPQNTQEELYEEITRLKSDNEMLQEIVTQLQQTLNRMIQHYITEE